MAPWKYWQAVAGVELLAQERERLEERLRNLPEGSAEEEEILLQALENIALQLYGEHWLYNDGNN